MTRECHVRFCERLRGKFLRPTHHFGMKAHIGVDAESGLVHTVIGTAANVNDVTQAGALLHGQEDVAFGDAGYQGVHKRPEAEGPTWHVAMRPGLRRKLNPCIEPEFLVEQAEKLKASVRAKVEHPFRVVKQQFGNADPLPSRPCSDALDAVPL